MNYKSYEDIPEWAKPIVEDLIDKGIIQYHDKQFEFDLSDEMLKMLVILRRNGTI